MQLSVRFQGEVAVVDLAGRLVYGDGDEVLKKTVQELVGRGTNRFVINLEQVAFMDSSGLVSLITCHKRATEAGGALRLLKPTRKTLELLTIARLIDILDVYGDEEAAIRSL